MIGTTTHQAWLFYLPLAQQASLLKDDLLDPVDTLLADPELVSLVRRCLAGRRPKSRRTGRHCAESTTFAGQRQLFLPAKG
jgi:hypothetical protein